MAVGAFLIGGKWLGSVLVWKYKLVMITLMSNRILVQKGLLIMDLKKAKQLPFDELRNEYREYLKSLGIGKSTVQTASSDSFYLWRKVSSDAFWDVIEDDDFDNAAYVALKSALEKNSTGNVNSLVSGYVFQLRRFRKFVSIGDITDKPPYKAAPENKTVKKDVPKPTPDQVEYYLQTWNTLENYHLQEEALNKLFYSLCPKNNDISDILLKVATLNDFYSTNIFSVYPVARHILSLDIDERLKAGDVTLIGEIQKVIINNVEKNFYSFATKYCSHHNPLDFPIYDSYVVKMLSFFRDRDGFAVFKAEDLKNYVKFKGALIDFRAFYRLDKYNLKEIDKYLWQLGKEFFPNHYGKK